MSIRSAFIACLTGLFVLAATLATAQTRTPSHCIALADAAPGLRYVHRASFTEPLPAETVRLSYIAHASFLLQTSGGLSAVTDFTGFIGNTRFLPDVVTMNHAHETHWTSAPDPAIPHVLPGWGAFGEGISHRLDLGEMLVRNVPTDIRSPYGGTEEQGNSIFIFEVAGLCIGHLGHLHHEPTPEQYAAIGRLDVVMAPVDGGYTLPRETLKTVLGRLRSSVVIPMHWFSDFGLGQFLSEMENDFAVVKTEQSAFTVSLEALPARPTIVVLRPRYLSDG